MRHFALLALFALWLLPSLAHGGGLLDDAGFDAELVAATEAAHYNRLVARHLPYGQPWTITWRRDDADRSCVCDPEEATVANYCGDIDPTELDEIETYGSDGDSALFTGHLLAMQAFKLAVTQDDAVYADFLATLEVIETMSALHPRPGLFVRSFVPRAANFALDPGDGDIDAVDDVASPLFGYRFRVGDMTRDQYSGLMWGLYVAYRVIDVDDVRDRVRELITDFARALIDNDYVMHDTVQDVSFDPGSFAYDRANMALGYLRLAYWVSGDPLFRAEFEVRAAEWVEKARMLNRHALKGEGNTCFFEPDYFQFNIVAPSVYMGATLTGGSGFESDFALIADEFYHGYDGPLVNYVGMDGEKNPLFDLMFALGTHGGAYDYWLPSSYDPPDHDAMMRALHQLALYPSNTRRRMEKLNPDIAATNKMMCWGDKEFMSDTALDIDLRPVENYAWEQNPHWKDSRCVQPWVEYPAADFLEAYWMAAYFGFGLQPRVEVTLVGSSGRVGYGSLSASIRVNLVGWIPHERWDMDHFYVSLYSPTGALLETQTITPTNPMTQASATRTISWSARASTRISGGTYRIQVHKQLYVPGQTYPKSNTIGWSTTLSATVTR